MHEAFDKSGNGIDVLGMPDQVEHSDDRRQQSNPSSHDRLLLSMMDGEWYRRPHYVSM